MEPHRILQDLGQLQPAADSRIPRDQFGGINELAPPRGMRDFYPEDPAGRSALFTIKRLSNGAQNWVSLASLAPHLDDRG